MTAKTHKTFTLITGASGGLGAAFARLCANDGRNLVLVGRKSDRLEELAEELKGDVTIHVIAQDLATPGAAQKVYTRTKRLHLTIDQLINCAGIGDFRDFARAEVSRLESIMAVNITSLTVLTRLIVADMTKRSQGRILNVGSMAGFVPMPMMSVYAASKSYVLSFSEALSQELDGSGLTVTCLCPEAIKTKFSRTARIPSTNPVARSQLSPETIARFGYRAMQDGVPIAIHGLRNQLVVGVALRLLPRAAIRRLMLAYSRL